jgi:hypothetical protein
VERADLGAIEFGGLLANGGLTGVLAAGETLALTQWGQAGASYGVFVGVPGAALDLGSKGVLFLEPSILLLATTGTLPAGGAAAVLAAVLPAAAIGLDVGIQAVQKGPAGTSGLHWTNLERISISP